MWKRKNELGFIPHVSVEFKNSVYGLQDGRKTSKLLVRRPSRKKFSHKRFQTTTRTIETVDKSYHRKYMKTATKHCPNNSATVEELCFVLCQSFYPYCRLAKLRERSPGFSGRCTIGRGLKFLRVCFFLSLWSPGISVPLVFSSYELSGDLQMDQPMCSVVILTSLFVMWSLYEMPRIRWYLIFLYSPAARVRICRNIKKWTSLKCEICQLYQCRRT